MTVAVPIVCHGCGQHTEVPLRAVASLSACEGCGSVDLDIDEGTDEVKQGSLDAAFSALMSKTATDLVFEELLAEGGQFNDLYERGYLDGLNDTHTEALAADPEYVRGYTEGASTRLREGAWSLDPQMKTLHEVGEVSEGLRCSNCLHTWTHTVTDPAEGLPPCPNCGAADTVSAAGAEPVTPRLTSRTVEAKVAEKTPADDRPLFDCSTYDPTWGCSFTTNDPEAWVEHLQQEHPGYLRGKERRKNSNRHEAKVAEIVEGILASNPGMNREAATKVARDTVRRFPKVAGSHHTAQKGWYIPLRHADLGEVTFSGPHPSEEEARRRAAEADDVQGIETEDPIQMLDLFAARWSYLPLEKWDRLKGGPHVSRKLAAYRVVVPGVGMIAQVFPTEESAKAAALAYPEAEVIYEGFDEQGLPVAASKEAVIQVRRKNHRGEDGWSVSGRPPWSDGGGWPISIWVRKEETARAIADLYRSFDPAAKTDRALYDSERQRIEDETSRLMREEDPGLYDRARGQT